MVALRAFGITIARTIKAIPKIRVMDAARIHLQRRDIDISF